MTVGCGSNTPAKSDGGAGTTGSAGSTGNAGTGVDAAAGVTGAGGDTGGAGTTGAAGTGTDGGTDIPVTPACYSVTFTNPVDLAQLSAADDKDGNNCSNGFQHDVVITTNAPNGTSVQLFANSGNVATVNASGGQVTFPGVQFASTGDTLLAIQFPSTMPCTAASTKAKVTVDCSVPTCSVTKPVISPAHPALNGVPATSGGDRVSATGSPYESSFEVTTNIANNQNVFLDINDSTTPGTVTSVTAKASGGKAVFTGVALPPGATYQVQARCIDGNGVVGLSTKASYPVDATAPDLTVSQPLSGDFIGPGGLTNGAFQVCGSTLSADAVNLSPALGSGATNFCASVSGSPICKAVTAVSTSTCVAVACPGDAPFSITVTLRDAAGNPQTQTINGVTCSSTMPNVQIISPVSDAPAFNDPTRHLLAASAAQPFRDQTGAVPGAQTDVVACASRPGTAALLAGHAGDVNLVQVGGTVPTTAATALDGCPSGLGFVARFSGVTLPESFMDASTGVLSTATQLRVDVTDVSASVGKSAALNLWVDSVAPVFALTSPVGLCGSFQQAFATYDTSIVYASDTPNITLSITNGSSTDTHSMPMYAASTATFPLVSFNQGQSNLAAIANDAAGNKTAAPQPCTVTAGIAPVVIFTTPTSTNQLCPSNGAAANCIDDADVNQAGWQGSLTVHALVGGLPITTGNISFFAGGAPLGVAALNASGDATLNNVTLFDGTVTITAQTDNISGNGVGVGTLSIVVDLGGPNAPTNLTSTVLDRRQTSFQLGWTAPGDNGQPVASYQVRYAKVPITLANFDNAAVATPVTFAGSPSPVGQADGIAVEGLYIENDYYFAVAAVDAAGNRSGIVATNAAVAGHFNVALIPSPAGGTQQFGNIVDGSGDGNDDGIVDLAIGTSGDTHAYIFFGKANFAPVTPDVTITGTNTSFGSMVRWIGDIDDDGAEDLAVSDPNANRVWIFKGRTNWPLTLTQAQADYTVTGDATYNGTTFGSAIARLGDFNGDGIDDFAVGASAYAAGLGRVDVIYGAAPFTNVALPSTTRALGIGGDPALNRPLFGTAVVGLGHFYDGGLTTLVASGPGLGNAASTSSNEGRVWSFRGRGPGPAIDSSAADNVVVGPAKAAKIGSGLVNLGPMINTLPSVGSGNIADTFSLAGSQGSGFVLSGTSATGPFANKTSFGESFGTSVGHLMFGGGFSGRDNFVSLIGGSEPDFGITTQSPTSVDIIDGAVMKTLAGAQNAGNIRTVRVPLPAGWLGTSRSVGNLLRDINSDGFADFALGDVFGSVPGRVAVFW